MSSSNGLICCPSFANVDTPLYLKADVPIETPTLVAPVGLASSDLGTKAFIGVQGNPASAYQGAINFTTGVNTNQGAPARDALTLVSETNGTLAYVGADDTNDNYLAVNGSAGLSRVYDEVYNPAVSLKDLTITNVSPTNVYDSNNPGEFFRCTQAGVTASVTAAIGCRIAVPKTGFYMVAAEVYLANAPAPDPVSINVPITVAPGGFNVGESLTMGFYGPVPATTATPYSVLDIGSLDFSQAQILSVNDGPVRQYTWMQKFDSTEVYTFLFKASSAAWNIGANGQIKVELIAMC